MVVALKKEAVDWLAPLAFPQLKENPRACIRAFLQVLGIDPPRRNKGRKECELYHKSLLLPDGQSGPTFYGKKDRYEARFGEVHAHLRQLEEFLNACCAKPISDKDARDIAEVVYAERAEFFPLLIALVKRLFDEDIIYNERDTAQGQGNAATLSAFDICYARKYGQRLILLPTMTLVDVAYKQDKLIFPDNRKLAQRLTSLLTDCCAKKEVLQGLQRAFAREAGDGAQPYELIQRGVLEFFRRCDLAYSYGRQNEYAQVQPACKGATRENDAFLPAKAGDDAYKMVAAGKGTTSIDEPCQKQPCVARDASSVEKAVFVGEGIAAGVVGGVGAAGGVGGVCSGAACGPDGGAGGGDEAHAHAAGGACGRVTAGETCARVTAVQLTLQRENNDFTLAYMARCLFSVDVMKPCAEDSIDLEPDAASFVPARANTQVRPLLPFVQPPKTPDELLALLFGDACAAALAPVAREAVFSTDGRSVLPRAAQFFEEGFGLRAQECFETCCALCAQASWGSFYNGGNSALLRAFFENATPEACSLLHDFHHRRTGRAVFLMALFALFGCDMIDEIVRILNQRNFAHD